MYRLFRVTARDHSAVILMTELAHAYKAQTHESLRDIANRMKLSEGYLEEVAHSLKKAGLIIGRKGPHGGYRLARSPKEISLEGIMKALEGPVELVDCQVAGIVCPVASKCSSKKVWRLVQKSLCETLRKTRLVDVIA